jgi:hypothetical protein
MEKNLGTADRLIRVLVAIAIIGLYYTGFLSGGVAIALLVLSAVFILTSFVSSCPLYHLLGIRSRSRTNVD